MFANAWRRFQRWIQRSETLGPVGLAIVVGLLSGLAAIILRYLIVWAHWFFFDFVAGIPALVGMVNPGWGAIVIVLPALGLALVSIVGRFAPEAMGHGIPEVQYAIRARGGRIRARVIGAKAALSAISIGSGGSVGREGPIVQMGAALGSVIGQITGLNQEQVKILVACGAAGALGASFNAPIAGVMFALEVVLGSFAARSFGLVVISSVTATALFQAQMGREPAFVLIQPFTLVSNWEFLLYLILGGLLGIISTLYVRSLSWFEDRFEAWTWPPLWKAVLGGLAVGLIGFFGHDLVFGSGEEGVALALGGGLTLGVMVALVILKILATSITLGAGASGGVFTPALFIGAMAGGAFGQGANILFPTWTAAPGAYALVGMAAVFAGAAHAPITGIVILFEMTDNYQIILPLMFSVVVSYLIAARVLHDSVYSIKLRRRGALTAPSSSMSVLDLLLVTDVMVEEFETVAADMSLEELAKLAQSRRTRSWPVVGSEGELRGIVTETDLERALLVELDSIDGPELCVRDVMTTAVTTCTPGDTLRTAFGRFTEKDVQQIPVLDQDDESTLVGVIRRHDMLWAYRKLMDEHQELMHKASVLVRDPKEDAVQIEVQVDAGDRTVANRSVRDIRVPPHALIVLVRRGERSFIPKGNSRIEAGDVLVLLTTRRHEDELRTWTSAWHRPTGGVGVPS